MCQYYGITYKLLIKKVSILQTFVASIAASYMYFYGQSDVDVSASTTQN
jgi:hypothetical protein